MNRPIIKTHKLRRRRRRFKLKFDGKRVTYFVCTRCGLGLSHCGGRWTEDDMAGVRSIVRTCPEVRMTEALS